MIDVKGQNLAAKVLYVASVDEHPGIYKKEQAFCKAMYEACQEKGIQFKGVNIHLVGSEQTPLDELGDTHYFQLRRIDSRFYRMCVNIKFLRILPHTILMSQTICKEIQQYSPDILVYRYEGSPLLRLMLFNPKNIKPDIIFISKHDAKEIDELRLRRFGFLLSMNEKLKGKKFLQHVDAVIGVTSEIAKHEAERAEKKIPYFIFSNGIDIKRICQKKYSGLKDNTLRMIFLSMATYKRYGLDRLLIGIANYRGNVNLQLNIIGSVTKQIKILVKSLGIKNKVFFHGCKRSKDIDKIFDSMHIAIGTLGLHRQNLKYGSTLKVREYMARGIPFVISHIDEDIQDDFPPVLRLDPSDNPVKMDEVIQFAKVVYEKYGSTVHSMMRSYALMKMDYRSKAKKFLDFILHLNRT